MSLKTKNILISSNSGYCMGVKKAFQKTIELSGKHANITVYGEMVHNRFALKALDSLDIKKIDDLEDIVADRNIEAVIIRAHGVDPNVEERLIFAGKKVYDFTCPKVKKVQLLAKDLTKRGYFVLIFGKPSHPEVIGIVGYCKDNNLVIKSFDEINSDKFVTKISKYEKVALISQTTMNSVKFEELSQYLLQNFSNIEIYNTLCKSPIKMQEEAVKLAGKSEYMIVVGDKMSANTTALFEKIKPVCNAVFVETAQDILVNEVSKYNSIGIAGGSSTPPEQIETIYQAVLKILQMEE